jgi:uncharacterized protein YoxC
MSDQKTEQKKTPKSIAVLTQLVNTIQDRVLWLTGQHRSLQDKVAVLDGRVRLEVGAAKASLESVCDRVNQVGDQVVGLNNSFAAHLDQAAAASAEFYKQLNDLKAEVERLRVLGVQRADLAGKNLQEFKDAATTLFQKLNERVSAFEGQKAPVPSPFGVELNFLRQRVHGLEDRVVFAEIANRDNAKVVNSYGDRLNDLTKRHETLTGSVAHALDVINVCPNAVLDKRLNDAVHTYNRLIGDLQNRVKNIETPAPPVASLQPQWSKTSERTQPNVRVSPAMGGTPGTCLGDNNLSSVKAGYLIEGLPLFSASTKEVLYKSLPDVLRLITDKSFVKSIEDAGFKFNPAPIIALVQELVDQRQAAQESDKPLALNTKGPGFTGPNR